MRLMCAFATAMGLVCFSGLGLAQDNASPAAMSAWFVSVDPSLGGCFASRAYGNGTILQMGLNRLTNSGYLAIGNPAWSDLQRGRPYEVRIVFGSAAPRDRRATAVNIDGTMTLWMGFIDADVIIEFMDAPAVQIWRSKHLLTELALRGSREAALDVMRCQTNR